MNKTVRFRFDHWIEWFICVALAVLAVLAGNPDAAGPYIAACFVIINLNRRY